MSNTVLKIEDKTIQPEIYDISNEAYHQGTGISRSVLMGLKMLNYNYNIIIL